MQQAKKDDFFTLFLEKKINGRLFYNTSLGDGTKEIKYGNEDFQNDDFKNAIDQLLTPFKSLSLTQVKLENAKPTDISEKMIGVINALMDSIESSHEWKNFWEKEIKLQSSNEQKKALYNLIAGAAAYKAFVSCIDQSKNIPDPLIKRNIAALVGICTNKYESTALKAEKEFALKSKSYDVMGDFTVFKKQKTTAVLVQSTGNVPVKKKHRKKKVEAQPLNALMK